MRPGTVFFKLTGSGNDFIALDGRRVPPESVTAETVRALCDRRHGAGADGLIVLAPATDPGLHFRFHFWNSDGSLGPMCGNGALCATRLAVELEYAPADATVCFATDAGTHRGRLVGENRSEIELPDCPLPAQAPDVRFRAPEAGPMAARPSVPHLVLEVPDVDAVDVAARGPGLRSDPALGQGGANVNWVSPAPGGGFWRMRTFERGVEGETLACGTGAVASALSLAVRGRASAPVRLQTRSGLYLDVSWVVEKGVATGIRLAGEGRIVYRAVLQSLPNYNRV